MRSTKLVAALISSLTLLAGCSNYTVKFRVADVINVPPNQPDSKAQQLDVDIVCLTAKEAEQNQDLVNGKLSSKEWFAKRDSNNVSINPKHIYALRSHGAGDRNDTRVGDPLLGAHDSKNHQQEYTVTINHTEAASDKAWIAIFGRFTDVGGGVSSVAPVLIQPKWRSHDLAIVVEKQSLRPAE